jgi:hypothetical protein
LYRPGRNRQFKKGMKIFTGISFMLTLIYVNLHKFKTYFARDMSSTDGAYAATLARSLETNDTENKRRNAEELELVAVLAASARNHRRVHSADLVLPFEAVKVETPPDGHCLWQAAAAQIHGATIESVRELVKAKFREWGVEGVGGRLNKDMTQRDLDASLAAIDSTTWWRDDPLSELSVEAIAASTGRAVIVFNTISAPSVTVLAGAEPPIAALHEGTHYSAVLLRDGCRWSATYLSAAIRNHADGSPMETTVQAAPGHNVAYTEAAMLTHKLSPASLLDSHQQSLRDEAMQEARRAEINRQQSLRDEVERKGRGVADPLSVQPGAVQGTRSLFS